MTTPVIVDTNSTSAVPWYRTYSGRLQVWYDASTLFEVFNGSPAITPFGWVYRKSTDAGATWGNRVALITGDILADVFYERWDNTSNSPYLHVVTHYDGSLGGLRGIYYNRLDLSSETLLYGATGTQLVILSPQPDGSPDTITGALSGDIHILAQENAFPLPSPIHRVSSDHGGSWITKTGIGQGVRDQGLALPDGASADPADICEVWISNGASTLYLSNYDASLDTWSTQAIATGWQTSSEDRIYRNIAAAYDRATGHIAFVGFPVVTSPNTLYAFDIYGSTVTPRLNVLTAVANANVCAVTITSSGRVRASYVRDGSAYWKESSDFMVTWGAEQAYSTLQPMTLVRLDSDPSPAVALFEPAYWTDITGNVPTGFGSHIYVEVPAESTAPPPPPPVNEAVPGVILVALYMEGVDVNSNELTLEQAPST